MIRTTLFSVVSAVLLLLAPWARADEAGGKAKIVTSMSNGAQCIAPVHIRRINDKEVSVNRGGFELEPGQHTMSGTTVIDTSACPVLGRATISDNTPPLEAEFEAGKTYWVGFDHKSRDRSEWKYVIWKVQDK